MPSVDAIRLSLASPLFLSSADWPRSPKHDVATFSSSLATSFFASPGRAAASCSASAAAKPSSSSSPAPVGDDTAEEEALCLLEEAAVVGALMLRRGERVLFVLVRGGRGRRWRGEREIERDGARNLL